MAIRIGSRRTFQSPFESCGITEKTADFNGKACVVVKCYRKPDAAHDSEALPMFRVRFSDGKEIEAFPEELHQEAK